MKRFLCLLLICHCITGTTSAAEKATKLRSWKEPETLDVATLQEQIEGRVRQIVSVRFNYRGKDIRHPKPNWYQSSLWQSKPGGKGFVHIQVMVAKKDLPAFKAITTNAQSPEVMTVYGEVLRDSERGNFIFVRLMGRNVAVDEKGGATLTW